MKNLRKLSVCLMAAMLFAMSAMPAFAATAGTEVWIQADVTTVDVTVPGGGSEGAGEGGANALPIIFNADGTNTIPTNWTITNNSDIASIKLTRVDLASVGAWKLLPADYDTKTLAANTKEIKFSMGAQNGDLAVVAPAGTAAADTGSANLDVTIAPTGSQIFAFEVERAAFTEAVTNAKAFDMTLTFSF